jgi:lipopolysaccharide biosynthesis protein
MNKRLALYAHYSASNDVALYVPFYLRSLRELGFRVCFISNSPIPQSKQSELQAICEKVIQRDNTGYDFSMWQQALTEFDPAQFDELLITNSSIIGPLKPLAPLWDSPKLRDCDFWGITNNVEFGNHLQTYFVVFRKQVLQSRHFMDFWHSVLPFDDKQQVIQSYETGLTRWLEERGFRWKALFDNQDIFFAFLARRSLTEKIRDRLRPRTFRRDTAMLMPALLLERGMPFVKLALLTRMASRDFQVSSDTALQLFESSAIPADILDELRMISTYKCTKPC